MAQVVECLVCKHEVLSSNPSLTQKSKQNSKVEKKLGLPGKKENRPMLLNGVIKQG
jgi:hypothetical protein